MDRGVIYTIGYGSRSLSEVIAVLRAYGVEYLIDVRSQPYSHFKPEFSAGALESGLRECGLRYVFMGDTLGGRPEDKACYSNGKVDYIKLQSAPFFREGIARLRTALDKGLCVALMCSEGKPHECHRSKLIGATLEELGVEVRHIDETGALLSQADALNALTHGQQSMFDGLLPGTATSRKAYRDGTMDDGR